MQPRYTVAGGTNARYQFSKYNFDTGEFIFNDDYGTERRLPLEDLNIVEDDKHLPDIVSAFATLRSHLVAHAGDTVDPVRTTFADDWMGDSLFGLKRDKEYLLAALPTQYISVEKKFRYIPEIQVALAKGPTYKDLVDWAAGRYGDAPVAVCPGAWIEFVKHDGALLQQVPNVYRTKVVCEAAMEADPIGAFPKVPEVYRTDDMESAYLNAKKAARAAKEAEEKAATEAKKAAAAEKRKKQKVSA